MKLLERFSGITGDVNAIGLDSAVWCENYRAVSESGISSDPFGEVALPIHG